MPAVMLTDPCITVRYRLYRSSLALNDLRDFEEVRVFDRRVLERGFVRQRRTRRGIIPTPRITERRTFRRSPRHDLRHRRNLRGIEFIELPNEIQDRIQVLDHALALFSSELEIGEVGNVEDLGGRDHDDLGRLEMRFHYSIGNVITDAE